MTERSRAWPNPAFRPRRDVTVVLQRQLPAILTVQKRVEDPQIHQVPDGRCDICATTPILQPSNECKRQWRFIRHEFRPSHRCDSGVTTPSSTIETVQRTMKLPLVQRLERSCGRARDDATPSTNNRDSFFFLESLHDKGLRDPEWQEFTEE